MNKLDKAYTDLLQDILDNGVKKEDRTGTGTISVFGRQIRHDMKDGFPLLTTKKMPWKTIVTELLWFLNGDTNIKYLVDNNCHIWDGDAYKNFEKWYNEHSGKEDYTGYYVPTKEEFIRLIKTDDEFAKKWGELGPIYGKQWRSWGRKNVVNYDLENVKSSDKVKVMDLIRDGGDYSKYNVKVTYQNNSIDQITNLIRDLKTNPDSRRLMVSAWNVGELDQMVLPPCHYGFQVYTRELNFYELRNKLRNSKEGWFTETAVTAKELQEECTKRGLPTRAISLMWNQRSVDTFLGLPFNIASYGLLLMMIADEVNMVPDQLIGNLGDVHLYSNHIEQAKEQIGRHYTIEERVALIPEGVLSPESVEYFNLNKKTNSEINIALTKYNISPGLHTRRPFPLPTVHVRDGIYCSSHSDVLLFDYQSHPSIKAPLSN